MVDTLDYLWISSKLLIDEANNQWLNVEILSEEKNLFVVSNEKKEILFKSTDYGVNSALGYKLADDKQLTYTLLDKKWFPVPKSVYLNKNDTISIEWFSFPLVIKPLDEAHGNWVMMNILSEEELKDKCEQSLLKYDNIIIQEQIEWDEIRVLVIEWEVILARNRIPAHVVGNGKSNIKQLIAIENATNDLRWKWYDKALSYIEIDNELISFIWKKELTVESVVEKWEYIQLRGNSNIGTWWTMRDVTEEMHESIKKICIDSCLLFWLWVCGVDVLSSDITLPLSTTWWVILELNATPSLGWEKECTNVDTPMEIINRLFSI